MLRFAGFELDFKRAELRAPQGDVIKLRPKTFTLLGLLAANANRLLTKQELMSAIWPNVVVNDDSLFQCIREIRTALGDKDRQLVKSIPGRGYLFEADVMTGAADTGGSSPSVPNSIVPEPADRDAPPPLLPSAAMPVPVPTDARPRHPLRRRALIAAFLACFAIGAAVATPTLLRRLDLYGQAPPAIAVMPIEARAGDGATAAMAANVTDQLTDGLSKIGNIRVLAPRTVVTAVAATPAPARADLVLRGELQRGPAAWEIQARLIDGNSGAVRWSGSYSVPIDGTDERRQESRLTAGIGYPLALQINGLLHAPLSSDESKIVIEQANAFINSTSRERAATAQAMLEKALAARPDDVDVKAALASQLLRSIQTAWYTPVEAADAEKRARALLETALKLEPSYIPALQGYCRLLTAVNNFTDSLVACERALSLEPWDGQALYQTGLSQLQLGRFEDALATFERADMFNTPQISRWTWLLGAGITLVDLERYEAAVPWLERSLAVTAGTGRTHMVLAAAYQALGRFDDAKTAMAKGLELRPGTNASNVALPSKNQSPRYRARSDEILKLMVAAGLPQN